MSFGDALVARALSALIGANRAAPVTERAFDCLAPAAFAASAAKAAEHLIKEVLAISRSVAIWTRHSPATLAVRAHILRHEPTLFPRLTVRMWEGDAETLMAEAQLR